MKTNNKNVIIEKVNQRIDKLTYNHQIKKDELNIKISEYNSKISLLENEKWKYQKKLNELEESYITTKTTIQYNLKN